MVGVAGFPIYPPARIDAAGQREKQAFLAQPGATGDGDYLQATRRDPVSPYEVKAGTVIPAVMIGGANSDVPGMIGSFAAALGAGRAQAAHIQDSVAAIASANGLKGAIYGLIIILFVLFEPLGLYGRWLKIKLFFQLFPLYKRATFKRQKIYVKSERNR